MVEHNDMVITKMEGRNQPPFDPKIWATLGDGIELSEYRLGQVIFGQGHVGKQQVDLLCRLRKPHCFALTSGQHREIGVLQHPANIFENESGIFYD